MADRSPPDSLPVFSVIKQRWSPLAFANRPVEPEKLSLCFEAARWAPSSFNDQPWRFIVATHSMAEEFAAMVQFLLPGNQLWAAKAPVLILSTARSRFNASNKENRHAWHDLGMATAHLVLQATELGLYAHQMAGFDEQAARRTCAIPESFEVVAVTALGYLGRPDQLPEELQAREKRLRQRRDLQEIVFGGSWNEPFLPG